MWVQVWAAWIPTHPDSPVCAAAGSGLAAVLSLLRRPTPSILPGTLSPPASSHGVAVQTRSTFLPLSSSREQARTGRAGGQRAVLAPDPAVLSYPDVRLREGSAPRSTTAGSPKGMSQGQHWREALVRPREKAGASGTREDTAARWGPRQCWWQCVAPQTGSSAWAPAPSTLCSSPCGPGSGS